MNQIKTGAGESFFQYLNDLVNSIGFKK